MKNTVTARIAGIVFCGWSFVATQYVRPNVPYGQPYPPYQPQSTLQVGPFSSDRACQAVRQAYISGEVDNFNLNSIQWNVQSCTGPDGQVDPAY